MKITLNPFRTLPVTVAFSLEVGDTGGVLAGEVKASDLMAFSKRFGSVFGAKVLSIALASILLERKNKVMSAQSTFSTNNFLFCLLYIKPMNARNMPTLFIFGPSILLN